MTAQDTDQMEILQLLTRALADAYPGDDWAPGVLTSYLPGQGVYYVAIQRFYKTKSVGPIERHVVRKASGPFIGQLYEHVAMDFLQSCSYPYSPAVADLAAYTGRR